jgi:transposase
MHAGRWAFNEMVQQVRAGVSPTEAKINEMCKATRTYDRFRVIHRCIFRNAMLDVRAALKTENTKATNNPRYHQGIIQCRSVEKTTTETIRLDAAVFKPHDKEGKEKPKDTGPILGFQRCVGLVNEPPAKRIKAEVHFGCNMKALGPVIIRDRSWLIEKLVGERYVRHQAKLHWDKRLRVLYLLVTLRQVRPPDPDPTCQTKRVVAMDPGIRHFQTFVDMSTGAHGELLAGYTRIDHRGEAMGSTKPVKTELKHRSKRIQQLRSLVDNDALWRARANPNMSSPSGKKARAWHTNGTITVKEYERLRARQAHQARRQAKRLMERCTVHLNHFKKDMHYATCGFLWSHWDTVIVSTASFGKMNEKGRGRPFGVEMAKQAVNWSHYNFRMRLVSSAFSRAGKYVLETTEGYTTKTCGLCGHVNDAVGGAEIYQCNRPDCGVHIDRDVNGARNIGLLVMSKLLSSP